MHICIMASRVQGLYAGLRDAHMHRCHSAGPHALGLYAGHQHIRICARVSLCGALHTCTRPPALAAPHPQSQGGRQACTHPRHGEGLPNPHRLAVWFRVAAESDLGRLRSLSAPRPIAHPPPPSLAVPLAALARNALPQRRSLSHVPPLRVPPPRGPSPTNRLAVWLGVAIAAEGALGRHRASSNHEGQVETQSCYAGG